MTRRLEAFVEAERERPLDRLAKGATALGGRSPRSLDALGPAIHELPTPLMVLDRDAVEHNVRLMAQWCAREDVLIAPHGKTTMAPALWLAQLRAGAWGITVANEPQLAVALAAGVSHVQVANTMVRPDGIRILSEAVAAGEAEALVWVDSVAAVELLAAALVPGGGLDVLVDVGAPGGRTGVRSLEDARAVAERVAGSPGLTLRGVAGYEGAVADVREVLRLEAYLDVLAAAAEVVAPLVPGSVLVSVGGSAGIAATVRGLRERVGASARLMIRSGAYVTHDDGYYAARSEPELPLRAAVSVWTRVLSAPEPGLVLADAGRRDVSFDQGMPLVRGVHRDGSAVPARGLVVTALNDQHGFVDVSSAGTDVRPGDLMEWGISHPCTTFDKWSVVLETRGRGSSAARVVDAFRTRF